MANINFIGKLRKLKENGYTEQEFSGGLIKKRLRCQMICGDNVQWLEAVALVWKDENKNKIYTMKHVEDGQDAKLEVKWSDRFIEDIVNSVAGYKKFVIDTDTFAYRKSLEEEGLDEELEKSKKKRKEFLHASDFIDYLRKVLDNEKSKDMVFRVTGSMDFSYSEKHDTYYRTFTPQKITRVPDDTNQICEGSMKIYFSENAVDDTMVDETGDIIFNAYTQSYFSNIKGNAFVPMSFKISKDAPKSKGFVKLFNKAEDESVKELGITCDFINCAKRVEISKDMLSDEQKEMIDMGMVTFEDIRAELGGSVYGDHVTEIRLTGLMKGYSGGIQDTVFVQNDLVKKPIKREEVVDIFSDSDDDEDI